MNIELGGNNIKEALNTDLIDSALNSPEPFASWRAFVTIGCPSCVLRRMSSKTASKDHTYWVLVKILI